MWQRVSFTPSPTVMKSYFDKSLLKNKTDWRKVLHLLSWVALASLGFAAAAQSETFRVELSDITTDAHPDDNFLLHEFNLGTRLGEIDSVRVEFVVPSGISAGYCTGGGCRSSFLVTEIRATGFAPNRPTSTREPIKFSDPMRVFNPFEAPISSPSQLYRVTRGIPRDHITAIDLRYASLSYPFNEDWPSFLYSGRGTISVQTLGNFSPSSLNSPPGTPSTRTHSKPPPFSIATLIIEGTAVPEPSACFLVLVCLGCWAGRFRGRVER